MRSPILYVFPHSQWRTHVRETWRYLRDYYIITGDENCSTHIHISLIPNYNLTDLKQIASAIIHFEEAFEALMPDHRRGNSFATSNWLGSPHLERQGRNRTQSIEAIAGAHDELELFRLIQGLDSNDFCWNFLSIFGEKGTIEFRQPPASLTLDETLTWAELAMNFIQASVQHRSSPLDFCSDLGGLRLFLEQVNIPGVNEPVRLQNLWADKPPNMALKPKRIHPEITHFRDRQSQLTERKVAEMRRARKHVPKDKRKPHPRMPRN